MSTSETTTFDANRCPCGKGKIVKHVTTQDNPWSGADISYELKCQICSADWGLEPGGVALVSHSSWTASKVAQDAWFQTMEPLQALVRDFVDRYFASFAARSKKAEWEEMLRLDIYTGNYRGFLKSKSEGKSPGEIAYGLRNRGWLSSLARARERDPELKELIAEAEARRSDWEEASEKVRRWPLDSRG